MKTLLNYAAVFIIFSGGWSSVDPSFAQFRLLYIIIGVAMLFWLPFINNVCFNRSFLAIFFAIVFFSFFNVFTGRDTLDLLLKQVVGIFINAVFFYLLIKFNKYDTKGLFKIYLNIAFFVALIGIVQAASYLLKFRAGYDYHWLIPHWRLSVDGGIPRVNSILDEAPNFCHVMMPALFVSLLSFLKDGGKFQKKLKGIVIITAFFLAFSLTGYIAMFFAIVLIMHNYRKGAYIFIGLVLICVLSFFIYFNVPALRAKADETFGVLTGKTDLRAVNFSSYSTLSNALVAYNSFRENPLFGSGLGSHPVSYERYVGREVPASRYNVGMNRFDANSLFLRLLSESGMFGVVMFFVYIFRFYISKREDQTGYLWIISNAVLSLFFIKLLRMGHYFADGFFFFIWLYYFAWVQNKALKTGFTEEAINENTPYLTQPGA